MTQDQSVLAAQRAQDDEMCGQLRRGIRHSSTSPDASDFEEVADFAATRIEQLNQELAEACHDRDRYQADCERLRAELATRPSIAVSGVLPTPDQETVR